MRFAKPWAFVASLALLLGLASGTAAQEMEEKAEAEEKAEMTVTLEAKNESGITGKAEIARAAEAEKPHAHEITVNISGAAAGTYPAHVHRGTCESGGGVATALTSITVEGAGSMASSTTVVTPDQLAAADPSEAEQQAETEGMVEAGLREDEKREHGPLFIQVHLPDGTPAACGDVQHGSKGEKQEKEGGTDR